MEELHDRRSEDKVGFQRFLCWLARSASEMWDWIDKRDIDKHVTAQLIILFMLYATYKQVHWGFEFAMQWLAAAKEGKNISGTEVAAVIASVGGPWALIVSTVVGVVVNFYFKARQ